MGENTGFLLRKNRYNKQSFEFVMKKLKTDAQLLLVRNAIIATINLNRNNRYNR